MGLRVGYKKVLLLTPFINPRLTTLSSKELHSLPNAVLGIKCKGHKFAGQRSILDVGQNGHDSKNKKSIKVLGDEVQVGASARSLASAKTVLLDFSASTRT